MNVDASDRQRQDWTLRQPSPVERLANKQLGAALPPIKMLDIIQTKREEVEYQARGTNMSMAPSATNSPTIAYPSGPPPPYSRPSYNDARLPTETRRLSNEDPSNQANKQSLPSIHEALGVEQPASYSSATHRPYSSAPQPAYHAPVTAPSPASPAPARRSFAMDPPPPPQAAVFTHGPRSPYSQSHQDISPRQIPEHERQRSAYTSQPIAPHTGQSPLNHQSQYQRSYPVTASHERTASHPLSMPPVAPSSAPPHAVPYGYAPAPAPVAVPAPAPYASHYAYPPPAPHSAAPTSSIYQPSITQPAPAQNSESGRAPFGDSVKRHLDMWDFGEALNEVCSPRKIFKSTRH
jgi:hypothetical protein